MFRQDLSHVTAVVLAGGLGTRLRPVVSHQPKVLATVGHRPFLYYLLERFMALNIKEVVLCTGYLGEQIQDHFGNNSGNLHLIYSQESSPLGTGGALRLAFPYFRSETILVMNGDSFCDADLRAFWMWHGAKNATASILLSKVLESERYGQVQLGPDHQITKFEEKGHNKGPGWVSAGIYLIQKKLLLTIPTNQTVSLEREIFPSWINQGLYAYHGMGRFLDIGTPESYALAENFLLSLN